MRERLLWVKNLTSANAEDKEKIRVLHNEIFGAGTHLCVNCPDSLRAGVRRLIVEYTDRYE